MTATWSWCAGPMPSGGPSSPPRRQRIELSPWGREEVRHTGVMPRAALLRLGQDEQYEVRPGLGVLGGGSGAAKDGQGPKIIRGDQAFQRGEPRTALQ